ncbi:hypothetical protein L9F63_008217, partial [Diploptera punctata]
EGPALGTSDGTDDVNIPWNNTKEYYYGKFINIVFSILQVSEFRSVPCRRQISPQSSPLLRKTKFILPNFLTHTYNCTCNMCNIPILQTLQIYTTYIQAEIYNIKSETNEAQEFFSSALQIYGKILDKQKNCIVKLISELNEIMCIGRQKHNIDIFGEHDLQLLLLPLKICSVIINRGYGDFLAACSLSEQAMKRNKETHQRKLYSSINSPIQLDAVDQLFCIRHLQASAQIPPKKVKENEPSLNLKFKQPLFENCRTPLTSSSVLNSINIPSIDKVKEGNGSHFKVRPKVRKIFLNFDEDYSEKENINTICSTNKSQDKCKIEIEEDDSIFKNVVPMKTYSKKQASKATEKKDKQVRERIIIASDDNQSSIFNHPVIENVKSTRGRKINASDDSHFSNFENVKKGKGRKIIVSDDSPSSPFSHPDSIKVKPARRRKIIASDDSQSSVFSNEDSENGKKVIVPDDSPSSKFSHPDSKSVKPAKGRKIIPSDDSQSSDFENFKKVKGRKIIISDDSSSSILSQPKSEKAKPTKGKKIIASDDSQSSVFSNEDSENVKKVKGKKVMVPDDSTSSKFSHPDSKSVKPAKGQKIIPSDDSQSSDFENLKKVKGRKIIISDDSSSSILSQPKSENAKPTKGKKIIASDDSQSSVFSNEDSENVKKVKGKKVMVPDDNTSSKFSHPDSKSVKPAKGQKIIPSDDSQSSDFENLKKVKGRKIIISDDSSPSILGQPKSENAKSTKGKKIIASDDSQSSVPSSAESDNVKPAKGRKIVDSDDSQSSILYSTNSGNVKPVKGRKIIGSDDSESPLFKNPELKIKQVRGKRKGVTSSSSVSKSSTLSEQEKLSETIVNSMEALSLKSTKLDNATQCKTIVKEGPGQPNRKRKNKCLPQKNQFILN